MVPQLQLREVIWWTTTATKENHMNPNPQSNQEPNQDEIPTLPMITSFSRDGSDDETLPTFSFPDEA